MSGDGSDGFDMGAVQMGESRQCSASNEMIVAACIAPIDLETMRFVSVALAIGLSLDMPDP